MKKLIKLTILLSLTSLFLHIAPAFAEGTYMLPEANSLIKKGKYSEAYELASKIIDDNPECWEAYSMKSGSALNLGNTKDALENINKAIKYYFGNHSISMIENDSTGAGLYGMRSVILFSLAFEGNSQKENSVYFGDLIKDFNKLPVIGWSDKGATYYTYFIRGMVGSSCSNIYKIRTLSALISNRNKFILNDAMRYALYGVLVKIAYITPSEEYKKFGTTKDEALIKIQKSIKRTTGDDDSKLNNDMVDVLFYLYTNDQDKAQYIYSNMKNNYTKIYRRSFINVYEFEDIIKRAQAFVSWFIKE